MKKDLSLALFLGIIVGGILTFGLYKITTLALRQVKNTTNQQTSDGENTNPTDQLREDFLEVDPIVVASQKTVAIAGKTQPLGILTVSDSENDLVFQANEDGSFSKNVTLIQGMNSFLVSLISPTKVTQSYVYIFYPGSLSLESDSYTTLIGSIIDLSDGSIQLNTYQTKIDSKPQIELLSLDASTIYRKIKDSQYINITKSEVAIGDFVVLTVHKQDNSDIQTATSVSIGSKPNDDKLPNFQKITVSEVTTKTTTAINEQGEEITLTNKNLDIYKLESNQITTKTPAILSPDLQVWLLGDRTIIIN